MNNDLRIGIDLGGRKIAVTGLLADGTSGYDTRIETPHNDYDATLAAMAELVRETERILEKKGTVGIAIPGSISPVTGLVQNANSTWLNGRDLSADLSRLLEREIRLANDANCFCLSEALDGAAVGANSVFGIILGTGCGAGLVVNDQIVQGKHKIAGEWGHTRLCSLGVNEKELPECWCGRRGCLELYVSGSGLERDHLEVTGEKLTARQIASSTTRPCQKSLERHASRLAQALGAISNILDPDVIVIGGGLSAMEHLYDLLPKLMRPYIFADHFLPGIKRPLHGDASGVRGAARLWP